MIQGPDKVIECPNCGSLSRVFTLISGNTFGARNWSDGKSIAPMLPEPPRVTRCATGSHLFWVSDAKVVGEIKPFGNPGSDVEPEWIEAPQIEELSFQEYLEAIDVGLARNTEEEELLRILAWWRENDAHRDVPDESAQDQPSRSPESEGNLRRLLELLGDEPWHRRLLKSEIYRELGEFDDALSMLKNLPSDAPREVVDRLRNLAMERNRNLIEFKNA